MAMVTNKTADGLRRSKTETAAYLNSTGCNDDKLNYLQNVASESQCDFIFTQEHWLVAGNLHRIKAGIPGYTGIANSGVDDTQNILMGRPYGGCAILWRTGLTHMVKTIQVESLSRRLCSVMLTVNNYRLLLICVYFPTDPGSADYNSPELDIVLSEICDLMNDVQCDGIIIGGDLNCDFIRNTGFVNNMRDFLSNKNLFSLWEKFDVDYTHVHTDGVSTSTIDHFVVSNNISRRIVNGGVTHSIDNTSNHSVIHISMALDDMITENVSCNENVKPKAAWYKASQGDINMYKNNIDTKLADLVLDNSTLDCVDPLCDSNEHRIALDTYFQSLIDVLVESGSHIPHTCPPHKTTRVPGWNELVKPYRDDALFWKWMHEQQGKPGVGWVAQIMRHTRAQYHYALRRCRKNKNEIQRSKFLEAMLSSDREFFKEVKRLKGFARTETSIIDGLSDGKQIADKFAVQYKELYNSNPSNSCDLHAMMGKLNMDINLAKNCYADCIIKSQHLDKAVQRLKHEKQDGVYSDLASDHFLNATNCFYDHLCTLFTKCFSHGYMPDAMVLSTLIPIPKDCNNTQCSDKYRGIALSAICNKLVEYIILQLYGNKLRAGDLQFAYKSNASTTQCTWMAREVISYYKQNDSDVYCCLLDCSKAFDRIRHDKLLQKLLTVGLPSVIIRALMFMYTNSKICVRWKGDISDTFGATNGVKQGSVLSPILFTLCLDDLLTELENNKDGCWIGNKFYGVVGYADDLKLMCPSLRGLQNMLNICKTFSDQTGLIFNATKTMCIKFHSGKHPEEITQYPVYLGNEELKWYPNVKHLGHCFNCCLQFDRDVFYRKGQFISCVNNIIAQFGFAHPLCKIRLLTIHGYSFYGSPLWRLYDQTADKLYKTWNIAIRRLLGLPKTTHTRFLTHIADIPHIKHSLKCRFIKFMKNALQSDNKRVQSLARSCAFNTNSITGSNISHLICEYLINIEEIENGMALSKMNRKYTCLRAIPDEMWKINMLKELIDSKAGISQCGFTNEELLTCIDYLATT